VSVYLTAREAVGGDPDQLLAAADLLDDAAKRSDALTGDLHRAATSTEDFWTGVASAAYRHHARRQAATTAALSVPLTRAAAAFRSLSRDLREAQQRADTAMLRSTELGMGSGDLVGRPFNVVKFVLVNPQHATTVAHLIGEVVGARLAAHEARNVFIARIGDVRTEVAGVGQDRRDPDERSGRRIRNDELFRRPEGGDRGGGHFDNDWAGRAILERYLRGGDDWVIDSDPKWADYMMDNQLLRMQLTGPAQEQAQLALARYLAGDGPNGTFSETFHAEIENGEGIVGYQYLHGTDADAGDFRFSGDTAVSPLPDGTYEVTIAGHYTWNDTIDPNYQYYTDTWKSRLAEIITLGQADPYRIHISWTSDTKIILDHQGNVLSIEGYPAP